MAMSRKNYEAMVVLIKQQKLGPAGTAMLAKMMCDFFQDDNPRFDREKFMEACGVI